MSLNQEHYLILEWLTRRRSGNTPPFQGCIVLSLEGDLDVLSLELALNEVIRRHESLRTALPDIASLSQAEELDLISRMSDEQTLEHGVFRQSILSHAPLALDVRDAISVTQQDLCRIAGEESLNRMNYNRPPLMRAKLFRTQRSTHLLVLTVHHLVFDGYSERLLARELQFHYDNFLKGCPNALPALPVQYPDFAVWQRRRVGSASLLGMTSYWEQKWSEFGDAQLQCDDMPFARPKPTTPTFASGSKIVACGAELTKDVRTFARSSHVTLYVLCLTAVYILFHIYSGKNRIAVWGYCANRTRLETENLIGWLANTRLLAVHVSRADPASRFMDLVRTAVLEANDRQEVPIGFLWERFLRTKFGLKTLFGGSYVSFDLRSNESRLEERLADGVVMRPEILPSPVTTRSLDLVVLDDRAELKILCVYAADRFYASGIAKMLRDLTCILSRLTSASSMPISTFAPLAAVNDV